MLVNLKTIQKNNFNISQNLPHGEKLLKMIADKKVFRVADILAVTGVLFLLLTRD